MPVDSSFESDKFPAATLSGEPSKPKRGKHLLTSHLRTTSNAMSFRKRNVGLASPSSSSNVPGFNSSAPAAAQAAGVRPSPLDGRPTTSTGTQSLDDLLAGHAGFPLGNSILIEESGTTDFAGALLRFYAAEGVVQGHKVHVVGVGEHWGRELPGVIGQTGSGGEKEAAAAIDKEKMKIAWRYERLGEFGAGPSARGGIAPTLLSSNSVHSSMRHLNNFGTAMTSNANSCSSADTKPEPKSSTFRPTRHSAHYILSQLRPDETPLFTELPNNQLYPSQPPRPDKFSFPLHHLKSHSLLKVFSQ